MTEENMKQEELREEDLTMMLEQAAAAEEVTQETAETPQDAAPEPAEEAEAQTAAAAEEAAPEKAAAPETLPEDEKDLEPEEIPQKRPFWKDLLETALSLVIMAAVVFSILHFVGQRVTVIGDSMNPFLHDRDQLLEDRFTYHFLREPERFEIVVFKLKSDPGTHYIKRIIGLPGETVQIIDSCVYINGELLEDPYKGYKPFLPGSASKPVVLGEDEYFVMGDNRTNSIDSRFSVGPVKREQINGRAVFRFWPFEDWGSLLED